MIKHQEDHCVHLDKSLATEERLPGHEDDPELCPDPRAAAALLPLDEGGDGVHQTQHRPHQKHHLGRGGGGQRGRGQGEHGDNLHNEMLLVTRHMMNKEHLKEGETVSSVEKTSFLLSAQPTQEKAAAG